MRVHCNMLVLLCKMCFVGFGDAKEGSFYVVDTICDPKRHKLLCIIQLLASHSGIRKIIELQLQTLVAEGSSRSIIPNPPPLVLVMGIKATCIVSAGKMGMRAKWRPR